MRRIAKLCAVIVSLTSSAPFLPAQDYGVVMERKIRSVLGKNDLKGYQFLSYPTNNFGLMTMYILDRKGDKPSNLNQECATFSCLGLVDPPSDAKQLKTINGYADIGFGAPLTLTETEKNSLTLSTVLPKILSILDVSGSFDHSKGITTTMALGSVTMRFLKKGPALTFINGLPDDSRLKRASKADLLAIVVADVVIDTMDISLQVDTSTNAAADATLTGKANQVFTGDDKLSFKLSKSTGGKYSIKVTQPVIVARLTATKPFGTFKGADFPKAAKLAKWRADWSVTEVTQ